MKLLKYLLVSISFIALASSCKPNKDKLSAKIHSLENTLMSPGQTQDSILTRELFSSYDAFFKYYSTDSLVPEMLYKGGQISLFSRRNVITIAFFTKLINTYPDYPKTIQAYLILGNFYANKIYDLDRANDIYDTFLIRYPNHELASQVLFLKNTLGKTTEELLDEIKRQNKH